MTNQQPEAREKKWSKISRRKELDENVEKIHTKKKELKLEEGSEVNLHRVSLKATLKKILNLKTSAHDILVWFGFFV